MKQIIIVTSNCYKIAEQKGAYGTILLTPDQQINLSECYINSTGPRMELKALIAAFENLNELYPGESCSIELVSKLSYLMDPFRTKRLVEIVQKRPQIKNYDLWKSIVDLAKPHFIEVGKSKSAIVNRFNKQALELAQETVKSFDMKNDFGYDSEAKKSRPKIVDVLAEVDMDIPLETLQHEEGAVVIEIENDETNLPIIGDSIQPDSVMETPIVEGNN